MSKKIACLAALLLAFSSLGSGAAPSIQKTKEVRGVWLHPGLFGKDRPQALASMNRIFSGYRLAGIDTIIALVKTTSGHVYFKSRLAVMDPEWDWDFAQDLVAEAQRQGLTVHAWFCVFPEAGLVGAAKEHPEWLIQNRYGELHPALNPAIPEARAYLLDLIEEFMAAYPVEWVHLDYIRYPCDPQEPYHSFDAKTRALFQAKTGLDPLAMKAKDSGNPHWNEWIEWNGLQVTAFLRELKERLARRPAPTLVSAAVFPDPSNAKVLIGQDWESWASQGLVDMLCPMLYTNDLGLFEKLTRRAVDAGRGRVLVCPGIGIHTSHNQNTPDLMMAEMGIARSCGTNGVVYFSGSSLTAPFLEKLKSIPRLQLLPRLR